MTIDIKKYVEEQKEELKAAIWRNRPCFPQLLILQRGDDSASNSYIKGKLKDCAEVGIHANVFRWFNGASEAIDFLAAMGDNYHGIILQKPTGLSKNEEQRILDYITPRQDVDGFLKNSDYQPCTPLGIMEILDNFHGSIEGKIITVIGKGELVGMPLVPMLMKKGATVISCNSKTPNLSELTLKSDIVVAAAGKAGLVTRDMLKDGAFVIDAGISVVDGKLYGDCDKSLYEDDKIMITTVPGGVGLMTRLELLKNTMRAAKIKGDY